MSSHFQGRRAPVCVTVALEDMCFNHKCPIPQLFIAECDATCWGISLLSLGQLPKLCAFPSPGPETGCWPLGREGEVGKPCCCVSCSAVTTALGHYQCYVITSAWAAMRRVRSVPARPSTAGIARKELNLKIPANRISFSPPFPASSPMLLISL